MKHQNTTRSKQLLSPGYFEGKAFGIALSLIETTWSNTPDEKVVSMLKAVFENPTAFLEDAVMGQLAIALVPVSEKRNGIPIIPLMDDNKSYSIFGEDQIDPSAKEQMRVAMKLPVTIAGALMPDAHHGYGLPIGGVLATNNAVIPYGVGVDIGCRMCLTVYDVPDAFYFSNESKFKRELIAHTRFGAGGCWGPKETTDHAVLGSEEFSNIGFLNNLQEKAAMQLGTSGGGNHFVEWGIIRFFKDDESLQVPAGKYLALLSHSGSRGLGAMIAGHYTRLAKEICPLPDEAKNLAYLDLNSEQGIEYWRAMNLAGAYASANHDVIHQKLTRAIGGEILARVENHHNFAWKEIHDGREVIVHRKGATPASEGTLGIIPGSMTAPGFLVRGKGESTSLQSASHGAGRQMSRTQAIRSIKRNEMSAILKDHGVTLIGAGLDEAPMAYKDIHTVMSAQSSLVEIIARFKPKMVRMADDGSRED